MNIIKVLEKNSKNQKSNKTFIYYNNKKYSYKKVFSLIIKTCNLFDKLKLKQNDRITLFVENSVEFVILYFASMRYGLVVNPSPVYLSKKDVFNNLNQIKPKFIFCSKNFNFIKKNKFFKNKVYVINDEISFLNEINKLKKNIKIKKINRENIAVLYYSSGSTGKSKLIQMSHRAIYNSQKMQLRSTLMKSGNNHLCILPLAHTSSLRSTLKFCAFNQRSVFLYKNFWTIKGTILDIIAKHKITFIQTVPSILSMLTSIYSNNSDIHNKTKSLKFVATGSSYLSKDVADKFRNIFNIPIINIYGLSETCALTMTNYEDNEFILNSVGNILPGIKYKLTDDKNKICKNGEPGELSVKTKSIFSGYYGKKINNLKKGSYFKTGDIFTEDGKGYLYFIERKKNIIIKSGINISAKEIDETLLNSKLVKDTFTTSIEDVFHGEVPISYIVPKKKFKLNIIENYCRKNLGDFKVPSFFKVLKKIPRSPTGKIQYTLLQK